MVLKLVACELKKKDLEFDDEAAERRGFVKREVTSAISKSHGLTWRILRARLPGLNPNHHQRQDPASTVCGLAPRRDIAWTHSTQARLPQ